MVTTLAMKQAARLIIPLWGEVYASKLLSMTLPALLAPGNLPALSRMFDVELVLVTEEKLFDMLRAGPSFKRVSELCRTKLVSLDDVMTDLPGDYGVVLTHALFRGFTDLGPRMTDTYLLFLNADFIISDGSLRHVGELMLKGERVIHAPSFRVVLEDVWPRLQAAVNPVTGALDMRPRDMVKLALANKHVTVKARTVNQRLCHQTWMDQFYWYVDDATLIGYQWPVALVAIKPERVVMEPKLVWDYGFIPEAAPTAPRHFIGDSDDFFMLEPQKRATGESMVRLGWTSLDDIGRNLSMWTTKEQRECGRQLLIFHSDDLPANLDAVIEESNVYMREVYNRLCPEPQPHIGHAHLGAWFESAKARMRGNLPAAGEPRKSVARPRLSEATLAWGYQTLFGRLPDVGPHHPLWVDMQAVTAKLAEWEARGSRRLLWLASGDSFFHRKLKGRVDPMALLVDDSASWNSGGAPLYDACLCELSTDELSSLRKIYARVRPMVRDGGEIMVYVFNKHGTALRPDDLAFCDSVLPDLDRSDIHFAGSPTTRLIRSLYLNVATSRQGGPVARGVLTAGALLGLAPFAWLANTRAARRDTTSYNGTWTSLTMHFKLGERRNDAMDAKVVALRRNSALAGE
jgi:hypothetical protein